MRQFSRRCDVMSTFPGWQWKSTFTSTPGSKDAVAKRLKLRWIRWLRMSVCQTNGKNLPRTCRVSLYVNVCCCILLCAHVNLAVDVSSVHSFPLGRNITRSLSCLFRIYCSSTTHSLYLCVTGCNSLSGGHEQVLLDKLSPVMDCLWAKSLKYDFQGWSMLTFPLH